MKDIKRNLSVFAVTAMLGLPGVGAAAGDAIVYDIVSGWTIRTDLTQNYACYAETLFEGDTVLRVGFNQDKSVFVRVGDPSWASVVPGEVYSVTLDFGDDAPWASSADGIELDTNDIALSGLHLAIDNADSARFMRAFMKEVAVDVSYDDGEALSLSLSGSYRAATKLDECQAAMAQMRRPQPLDEPNEKPLQAAK